MSTGKLIGGQAYFTINGERFSTDGEFTISAKNKSYEAVAAADGSIHRTESVVPATVSGNLFSVPDLDYYKIVNMAGATVQIALKNGQTFVLRGAFFTGSGEVNALNGKISVEFAGQGDFVNNN